MASSPALATSAQGPATAWALRLILGLMVALGAIIFLLGTSWDIQWHTFIGRDRTLIPPHIMMLAGVALSGVAALVSILGETALARRIPLLAQHSTRFASGFQSSMGAYLAGYAALAAAIAFPLDSYWHALYGIDVAIWAPFHIMFIGGMALVGLGAAYMLASTAHLAHGLGARGATRMAYMGVVVAVATTMGLLTLLLFDAFLGPLYPILACFLSGWLLVAIKFAVPWRWSAVAVVGVYALFAIIVFFFVPVATDHLVLSEQLAYRRGGFGQLAVVALNWPLIPVIAAFFFDGIAWAAKARHWSDTRFVFLSVVVAVSCGFWLPIHVPLVIVPQFLALGSVYGLVLLVFGIIGAYGGVKTGQQMGLAMQHVEGD